MSGIAGILDFSQRERSNETLQQMTQIMRHRGPDELGLWTAPGIGLGCCRLNLTGNQEDWSRQLLCNEDESIRLVFDGVIFNYSSLRKELELRGHQFQTNIDMEVVIHLYEEWGIECVQSLRGMFAFALWDQRKRQLFAARDFFGTKPFYYYAGKNEFVFASEIKSILSVEGIERQVHPEAFLNYLTFQYVPEPMTMFEKIHKLPPAHTLTVDHTGRMDIRKYWEPSFEPSDRPFSDFVEEIRERIKASVADQLRNKAKRGCFLSSGIDSTAIAAYMRSMEPIRTFSVGFDGPMNETTISRETAQVIGTEHIAKVITEDDFFQSIPKAVWHLDEPIADPSAIALYHIAQLASEHVQIVLSGEGADELFGGYRIYREPYALRAISWLPLPLKRWIHRIVANLPPGWIGRNYILRGTTPLEERFIGNARIFSEEEKSDIVLLHADLLDHYRNPLQIVAPFYERTKHLDPVSRMQYIDLNLWLPGDILMKADKMTQAHSLEARMPLLDVELFNLARQIPASYRIAKGTTKMIFRKAMEGIVPDFILHRPKLGFPVPLRQWLQGERGIKLLEHIKDSGIAHMINVNHIESMLKKHQQGQGDYSRKLWIIYVFALWYQTYMTDHT